MFISRIAEDNREQLTKQHLQECADYARAIGAKFAASEICYVTALLHDIGKFSSRFNEYLKQSHIARKLGQNPAKKGLVIHSTQGAIFMNESRFKTNNLIKALVREISSICIANHHGSLMDIISPFGETPFLDRLENDNEDLCYDEVIQEAENEHILDNIVHILERCEEELKRFVESCKINELNIPFMLHLLTKGVFSCLVDSDRYNAYCFEINKPMGKAITLPQWDDYIKKLEMKIASFSSDSDINLIRRDISENCLRASKRPKGIYRLDVPTGGGKTLSSLRYALNHAKIHNMEHVIYVIPYLSVLEQTAKDIKDALQFNTDDDSILEHHSNYVISDNPKEAQSYQFLTDRWDCPIVVTTMVQFLESIYSNKSSDLRKFHNIFNAVIIFDEVQSLPLKCTYLFNEAINFLYYCANCSILLCTATQPSFENVERPVHLSKKPSLIPDISKRFSSLKRTFIKDCTIPGGYSTEELKYFIIDKYREERSCLVIVNTKKDAAKLYFVIESYFEKNPQEHIELIHLSTMMCPAHRMDAIQKVKEKKKNILCISTQLIEAGVDISFGCVVRVIAGLDSIAQAAGRCNRHGEDPNGKNVYIVNLAEEDLSRLPDIKCGADITYRILAENPDDLLSPSTINRYYKEYFYKQTFQMSYRVKDYGNLYDLLSINNKGTSALLNKGEKNPPALRQAFQTAGELFSVIDQRTISVLVPYKDGAGLSKEYQHADINKKRSLLRQIGRYSVSLYHYQISKLNDYGALTTRDDEIFVLDSKYYSDKLGVVFDSKNNFLIV